MSSVPAFAVIPGTQVHAVLAGQEKRLVEIVADAYRRHDAGVTVNPPSAFLTFPDRPDSRIIALPASLGGEDGVDGIKWISSFPSNVDTGMPRASAVLLLNDPVTGYPYACMEASIVSAVRTAASAALAAERLSRGRQRPRRLAVLGTGLIARYTHGFLAGTGWDFDDIALYDLSAEHAAEFRGYLRRTGCTSRVTVHPGPEAAIRAADLVLFATVAGEPHVQEPGWFAHRPVVLHLSLRDLAPRVLLSGDNFVDDVDHAQRARTSTLLAEELTGDRDFLSGTLADVLLGRVTPRTDRPVFFSPFGLGVLDLAVGRHVYRELAAAGVLAEVDGFFHDLRRYG
ncbi:2,3-diaminopropionate biosynthesis protein SbnB [Jidongwangia harbinensis]|uniref:2,3-diaminopropionate biosynthesis protein SbnB n=1 Tax=Jidongwangia harbinensis TaxID=2878561 RepID=UPI001CDA33A0|nr:2,3-diaminopropionate biosynthesis protein SbnB [Jidongwangia harbinensis]MCA2218372.1 2,3-diaminopropionate biosynthesis protein SbnB [Jidongwangia harbinensis]